jgi:manganese/zinc/iron transport system ATP- binding protein
MSAAITVNNLNVRYNYAPVLSDISLSIPEQNMAAIIGPNGAGKSSLLKSLVGLIKPDSGEFSFFGANIEKQRMNIAYVAQRQEVDWDFPITVREVVEMGRFGHLSWWQRLDKKDSRIVDNAMQMAGVTNLQNRQISELSGGQQQRMFVARALAQQANIYLLDEPFAGIDVSTEKALVELFKKLVKQGATIVAVHHDVSTVKDYFDYALLLNQYLIAQGKSTDVLTDENLKKTYTAQESVQDSYNMAIKQKQKWPIHD